MARQGSWDGLIPSPPPPVGRGQLQSGLGRNASLTSIPLPAPRKRGSTPDTVFRRFGAFFRIARFSRVCGPGLPRPATIGRAHPGAGAAALQPDAGVEQPPVRAGQHQGAQALLLGEAARCSPSPTAICASSRSTASARSPTSAPTAGAATASRKSMRCAHPSPPPSRERRCRSCRGGGPARRCRPSPSPTSRAARPRRRPRSISRNISPCAAIACWRSTSTRRPR